MEKVGKEGVITVADGNTLEDELDVVEGMKLGRGYISPYFVTDQKTQKCELENPLILIHDKKISDMNSLVRILELAVKKHQPLLVVAEDVESDALAMLIINKHRAGVKPQFYSWTLNLSSTFLMFVPLKHLVLGKTEGLI
ncbi:unnamed protein product [Camellia sinensis]